MRTAAKHDRARFGVDWVVLDVTGTLLVPNPHPAEVYGLVAEPFGLNLPTTTIKHRMVQAMSLHFGVGATAEEPLLRDPTNEQRERQRWQQVVFDVLRELSPRDRQLVFVQLWDHFAQPQAWRWQTGMQRWVSDCLEQGLALAIATNFDQRVHRVLDHFVPLDCIEARFLSAEIGFSKPDPRFFATVSQRLGRPANRLVMIGDDEINDLAGSNAAGWQHYHVSQRPQPKRL